MPKKESNKLRLAIYFSLAGLLVLLLILHAFGFATINTDGFTKYIIALLFVLLVMPLVPYVKIFDVVEFRRTQKILKVKKK